MTREQVEITAADGPCRLDVHRPASGAPWPALILYADAFGPRPAMDEIAARIAAHGTFVIVPDIFYRTSTAEPVDVQAVLADREKAKPWFAKIMSTATPANVVRDTALFLDYLAAQPDVKQPKVATTGYCMGGNRSLHVAAAYPDRIAACASYHGGGLATDAPDSPHLGAPRIKARVYVAGAIEDQNFTDEQKQRLIDALTAAGVAHTVETYPGCRHGWVPSDMPVYNAEGAKRHDETLLALLNDSLR